MRKLLTKIAIEFAILFFALGAIAQSSSVTFTNIQDTAGQVFANGTISYQISPNNTYTFNGSPLPAQYYSPQTVVLDATGSGTVTLPRNDYIVPINSVWKLSVCSNTSAPCTTVYLNVTTATYNPSAIINAQIPPIQLTITNMPRAYSDAEIGTAIGQGGIYYNTYTAVGLRYWNGSSFQAIGSGGGGSVSITPANASMLVSPNPLTGTGTVAVNPAYQFNWTGMHSWTDGGTPANQVEVYNDPTNKIGVYFYRNGVQYGGVTDSPLDAGLTWHSSTGYYTLCDTLATCTNNANFQYTGGAWHLTTPGAIGIGPSVSSININQTYLGGLTTGVTASITNSTNTTTFNDTGYLYFDISGTPILTLNSTQAVFSKPISINGTNNGAFLPTAPLPTPIAADGGLFVGSDGNMYSSDNGAPFARICNSTNGVCSGGGSVADFTVAVTSATQGANSCSAETTVAVTGLTTSMAILPAYLANVGALTGWGSSAGMNFYIYPKAAGSAAWYVCNTSGAPVTYSAVSFINAVK